MYITDLVDSIGVEFPSFKAIIFGGKEISYKGLIDQSNRVANYMRAIGVCESDIVSFHVETKSIELIVVMLGILKVGASYLFVNDKNSLLDDLNFKLSIYNQEVPGEYSLNEIILSANAYSATLDEVMKKESTIAYHILTSGTTGLEKLIAISHRNILETFFSWRDSYDLVTHDVHLQMAPVAFDVFTGDWVRALCSGSTLVLCDKDVLINSSRLFDLIQAHSISIAEFVPSVLRSLMCFLETNNRHLSTFRMIICGSDILYMRDFYRLANFCCEEVRMVNSYGVSEATIDSTYFEWNKQDGSLSPDAIAPIGRPFAHVFVDILSEFGEELPVGRIGEMVIGGRGVAPFGYILSDEKSRGRFINHPSKGILYMTGDKAKILECGNLLFIGRNEDHFSINGKKLYFIPIENAISSHSKIKSATVIPVSDGDKQYLEAYLVVKNDLTLEDIIKHLGDNFPSLVIPRFFYKVNRQEVTRNGKVSRDRSAYSREHMIRARESLSGDFVENIIRKIWSNVLKVPSIPLGTSFYYLSGTSIDYIKVIQSINEIFLISIPILSRLCTVEEMSSYVRECMSRNALLEGRLKFASRLDSLELEEEIA